MKSNEEYLLRAIRRTIGGLTDSLIPAHGKKLSKLLKRLESADSISSEVQKLLDVQGFGKCALAMEWLLQREERTNGNVETDQFESDVLFLNEKLFEAFLNQPFEMPDFSRSEHSNENSENTHQSNDNLSAEESAKPNKEPESLISSFETSLLAQNDPQEALSSAPENEISPSLSDSISPELFESAERVAQTAVEFLDKPSAERPVAMAVLRVTIRAANETAKSSGNIVAGDFFEALLKVISYADEQGKIKSDEFSDTIRDVGDRLLSALKATSGGITLLKNITVYIKDPKELLRKK